MFAIKLWIFYDVLSISLARAATSKSESNGNNWFPNRDEYDSDKDEDEEAAEDPLVNEIGPQLPGLYDGYQHDDNLPDSGIIVTVISPSGNDKTNEVYPHPTILK